MITDLKAFAKPYFENNEQLFKLYITDDGHAWTEEIYAIRHCKQDPKVKMHEIKRSDVIGSKKPKKEVEEVIAENEPVEVKTEVEVEPQNKEVKAKPKQKK